ncbi:hypothetical protein [Acidithiobacillus thiooxidans]|jgi:hypothetical protein|uniref:hypothetical protein n=1 Tax=Acidithiobacillus thiooxidans TaxID=930 RepID=UPI0035619D3F
MQLDSRDREAIEDIINRRAGITSMQAQLKEDIKAIAERTGTKPAQINKIISLVEKERDKGDVLAVERDIIDVASDLAGGEA